MQSSLVIVVLLKGDTTHEASQVIPLFGALLWSDGNVYYAIVLISKFLAHDNDLFPKPMI